MNSKLLLKIDRGLAEKGFRSILYLAILSIVCLVISIIIWGCSFCGCFYSHQAAAGNSYQFNGPLDGAFYSLFTSGGQNLFPGNHAAGAFITVLGILIIALITSALTNLIEKRAEGYLTGETAYRLKDHIVILGANDIVYSIINQKFNDKANQYILIQTSKDVKRTRNEVFSFLDDGIDKKRIVFIYGDRTSPGDIKRLNLTEASEIFIIGDTREGEAHDSYRDAYNMDSVNEIAKVLNRGCHDRKIDCHVLFEYQTTSSAFQFAELSDEIKRNIVFKPFNFYEMWAAKILTGGKANCKYEFLDQTKDGNYINESSEETVHLIIVGMSKMGIALAIEAAHMLHFPNFVKDPAKKTRITFIDENADEEKDFFMGRFKELFRLSRHRFADANAGGNNPLSCETAPWNEPEEDWLDIEWEFIKGRVEQNCVQNFIAEASGCPNRIVTISVCLPMAHQAIAAAMYLPDCIYKNCLQILTYQKLSSYMVGCIAGPHCPENSSYRYNKLRPFGMIDEGYDENLDDDTAAMMVAYVYDSYYDYGSCDVELKNFNKETYREAWNSRTVWERWSSTFNANSIGVKLRSANDVNIMAAVEHNRWNIEKLLTGFRALNAEESRKIAEYKKDNPEKWNDYRKQLKKWPERAHLDLCSNEKLPEVDPEIVHFDFDLSRAVPFIFKLNNQLSDNK